MLPGGANAENADHQFLLFSATFNREARQLAREYLSDDFVRIRVGRAGSSHANITQDVSAPSSSIDGPPLIMSGCLGRE